jgi:hypothetical protein
MAKTRSETSAGVEAISLVFSGYDWCIEPGGFPPQFTKTLHNHPHLKRFLR